VGTRGFLVAFKLEVNRTAAAKVPESRQK